MMSRRSRDQGFALPSVVIAALVMFTVLTALVGSVSSVKVSLDTQFYQALARDAAESGSAYAEACLKANNYIMTWTAANPLRPNTTCTGGSACTGASNCYLVKNSQYATSYTVTPGADTGGGVQEYVVDASVDLLRTSTGASWKNYTKNLRVKIGGQVAQNRVVFGYNNTVPVGAFFAIVSGDGKLRVAGQNNYGQLGTGNTTDTNTPVTFNAPTSYPINAAYTNFLSIGWNLYALDTNGDVYASGRNDYNQLGIGVTGGNVSTPARVLIPAGKKVRHVVPGGWFTHFITTDNNIYAAGMCEYGALGANYTISGCSNQSTPVRVALPTPTSDPATIPTSNIVSDRYNTFVRMSGGQVYGWGDNHYGQLGNPDYTPKSSPVKIGTYGDPGQPKAVDVQFNGDGVYILDDTGVVNTMGFNNYGQLGSRTSSLYSAVGSGKCLDNTSNDGSNLQVWNCNNTAAQRFTIRSNSTIYYPQFNKCIENKNADGTTLWLNTCNGAAAQVFTYDPASFMWRNPQTNKCIGFPSGSTAQLMPCNLGDVRVVFSLTVSWLTPFNMAGISGKIVSVTTDQWQVSVLTDQGEVWSTGINSTGMAGNGRTGSAPLTPEFDAVKFQLPAGVKGNYIYSTNCGTWDDPLYKNLFVVGDDGKVYGAGSNQFGQLGNGTTSTMQTSPVVMSGIDGTAIRASQVQSGLGTTVIFTTANQVYTVGNNNRGQLGDGSTTNRSTPFLSQFINTLSPIKY